MTKEFIYNHIKTHSLAAIASISLGKDRSPQAALVGIAVTNELEIIFDTLKHTRKYANIKQNPKVALVIGWEDETSVQYEGVATELGKEDQKYREIYFKTFPEGRQRAETWEGLVHFKVTPTWIRYSNFNEPPQIEEMTF